MARPIMKTARSTPVAVITEPNRAAMALDQTTSYMSPAMPERVRAARASGRPVGPDGAAEGAGVEIIVASYLDMVFRNVIDERCTQP
jgi:hypothetical protein